MTKRKTIKLLAALTRVVAAALIVGTLSTAAAAQIEPAADPSSNTAAGEAAPPRTDPSTAKVAPFTPAESGSVLPRDLTPWGMCLNADIVVKVVMVGLVFASVVTWTIALAKGLEVAAARRRLRRAVAVLAQAPSLAQASRQLAGRRDIAALIDDALAEVRMSVDIADRQGIKDRIALRLERNEAAAGRRMTRGTGVLATIGAIAPFVGLFGTVWGIMNSFIGISRLHTTNLAVVAPGIAEALLATALGLLAAIPAVVIYNMFSRSIAAYRALCGDATAEVLRLAGRDLDREASRPDAASSEQGRWTVTLSAAE